MNVAIEISYFSSR